MSNPSKSFLHSDDQQAGQVQKVKKSQQVTITLVVTAKVLQVLVVIVAGQQWQGWGRDVACRALCCGGLTVFHAGGVGGNVVKQVKRACGQHGVGVGYWQKLMEMGATSLCVSKAAVAVTCTASGRGFHVAGYWWWRLMEMGAHELMCGEVAVMWVLGGFAWWGDDGGELEVMAGVMGQCVARW
ncbi:hypothetical protein EDB86DRAFT_2825265 [Lactarius hatsudake]|nr:hypothetical protein EDB86DRAFT_2825265 [Lactarius hatsudake]